METAPHAFEDMPGPLLDFALSQPAGVVLDLFTGGLVARCSAGTTPPVVAMIKPDTLTHDADTCADLESAIGDGLRQTLSFIGFANWPASYLEDAPLNDQYPDLEFFELLPDEVAL